MHALREVVNSMQGGGGTSKRGIHHEKSFFFKIIYIYKDNMVYIYIYVRVHRI